jgi:hypothetical protein
MKLLHLCERRSGNSDTMNVGFYRNRRIGERNERVISILIDLWSKRSWDI